MKNNKQTINHPGVYIPPPLIYAALFLIGIFIQKLITIKALFFYSITAKIFGFIFLVMALCFLIPALRQFLRTKNTLVTVKPANSLQTTGIYDFTRNPMYTGLSFVYLSLSFFFGNWWNLILFPVLVLIVQEYIIKREEKYLMSRFSDEYINYKKNVRRWI